MKLQEPIRRARDGARPEFSWAISRPDGMKRAMSELVASFRRPLSPRPLTRLEHVLSRLGARFDEYMVRRWMRDDAPRPVVDPALRTHLETAHAFYSDGGFLADPASFFATPDTPVDVRQTPRRKLRRGTCVDVDFPTAFRPVFPAARASFLRFVENAVVHARWWRHDGTEHPTVVCLHGYASGDPRIDALAFSVRRLYRAGLDVILYTLPFHGRRRPGGAGKSGEAFFDLDMARTNEAFAQTMFEARALLRLAVARGARAVGAFGMSLGGYATALLASVEPRLDFAVSMIPVASLPDLVWGEPLHRYRRQEAEAHGMPLDRFRELWQVHAPLRRTPVVPAERRLVIGALGDRICPPGHADALWRHWGQPSVHWFAGGHLAQFHRGAALATVRRFLRGLDVIR
jgi:hypothetical protein